MNTDTKTTVIGGIESLLWVVGAGILSFADSPAGKDFLNSLGDHKVTLSILMVGVGALRMAMGFYTNKGK